MRYSVQTQNVIDEVAKPLNDFSKNAEQAAKKVFEKTKSAASQALELSDDVIEDGGGGKQKCQGLLPVRIHQQGPSLHPELA